MSESTEEMLISAIRTVNDQVSPILLSEIVDRPMDDNDLVVDLRDRTDERPFESASLGTNRRALVVVGAAVAIVAVLVAMMRQADMETVRVTDRPTTTASTIEDATSSADDLALAIQFSEAFEQFDAAAARPLMAEQYQIQLTVTDQRESVEEEFAAWDAVDGRVQFVRCEPLAATLFGCEFVVDDKMSRAQSIESLEVSVFVAVEDGLVRSAVIEAARYQPWAREVWGPFGDWLETDPVDDIELVYPAGRPGLADVMDPAARLRYEQLTDEFVRKVGRVSLTENEP